MASPELTEKIISAINDAQYKWRTIKGLSKEIGESEEEISEAINDSEVFLRSMVPNEKGEALYTTLVKYKKDLSFLDRFVSAGSNHGPGG